MLDWQHHEAAAADCLEGDRARPEARGCLSGLGYSLAGLKQLERSIASFDQAMALDPGQKYLIGTRRAMKMQACDWNGLAGEDLAAIIEGVNAGRPVCNPLGLAQLVDSPSLHRAAAESWAREESPPDAALGSIRPRSPSSRFGSGIFPRTFATTP